MTGSAFDTTESDFVLVNNLFCHSINIPPRLQGVSHPGVITFPSQCDSVASIPDVW